MEICIHKVVTTDFIIAIQFP